MNLDTMNEYGVVPEACLFNEGMHDFFTSPILAESGEKYGKSVAQVALCWNIQRGVVVIPKSVHEDRIKENFDVFDFSLSQEDMEKIKMMDLGQSEEIILIPNGSKMLHPYKTLSDFRSRPEC